MWISRNTIAILVLASFVIVAADCQKTVTAPPVSGVANLTVVNAVPNSSELIPVINSTQPIVWFAFAQQVYYSSFYQYSLVPGYDTVDVVQSTDTLDVGPKAVGQVYYGILSLIRGGNYSLFICGSDTTSSDYLFTIDTIPYHGPTDSAVGVRFVNLSAGSNPISVNLEGSPNGSEVSNLPYKGITGFKEYISNSSVSQIGDIFVFRDAVTGDSLTAFQVQGFSSGNGYVGLQDPVSGGPLVFKNITIALIGQPGPTATVPQTTILIDNY